MISSLSDRNDLQRLQQSGTTRRSGPVRARVLIAVPAADTLFLGFTIGRRFGHAVDRNRMRRRLRHCVRDVVKVSPIDTSHVLLGASRSALDTPYDELLGHCRRVLGAAP